MDSRKHPQPQPHHHQQQPPPQHHLSSVQPHHQPPPPPQSYELEQPDFDMVRAKVTFSQHQLPNLQQNPLNSASTPTPVVNQADSAAVSPVPLENPTKKARGRPPGSRKKLHPNSLDSGATASENPTKKARGRPSGSGKKKQPETLGAACGSMNHIILVDIGQDIVSKIMTFLEQGPPAVCILSGVGFLCEVTLWQPAIDGGAVTHEGQFDITSLSGSFMRAESGVTGGLNLSMTRPDGSLFGGVVEGKLRAATPVQVTLRSFIPYMEKPESKAPSSTPPSNVLNFGPPVTKATSPTQVPHLT